MKRICFITILTFFAVFSYAEVLTDAQNIKEPNNTIFVEGTASRADHADFFKTNFRQEATALGYTLTDNMDEAGFIYRYNVVPNIVMYEDGIERPAPSGEPQYIIKISVIRNEDDLEILSYDVLFTELAEIYEYNQLLFFRASLPFAESEPVYVYPDTSWKNKWIYLRASFDYPITFYTLQPDDLFDGKALYKGNIDHPDQFSIPLNHRVNALPGATVGVEVQFLNFMSAEVNFQINFGDTVSNKFINMAAGAQLKFPLKFVNSLIIAPYGAFTYQFKTSDVFESFPPYAIGGGIQVCTKGGKNGAFFVDVNYMYSLEKAALKNLYKRKDAVDGTDYLYDMPKDIKYKRFVLGLSVGYKYGLINRKK